MDSPFVKGKKKTREEPFGKWESIIERELRVESKGYRNRIFASSAGLCERQTAGLLFLPKDFKSTRRASTEFYFKVGNTFEDIVAKAFSKADIMVDRETRIEAYHDKLPISGRIDFVLDDPEEDGLVLVELKSCGKLPASPRASHKAQLMTYLVLTGMPKGIIWYISRSVAGWKGALIQKTFEIEPTNVERRSTIFRMAYGSLAAKKRLIPSKPEDMKKYKCGFCTLIPYCWDDDEDLLIDAKMITRKESAKLLEETYIIIEEVMEHQKELRKQFEGLMVH